MTLVLLVFSVSCKPSPPQSMIETAPPEKTDAAHSITMEPNMMQEKKKHGVLKEEQGDRHLNRPNIIWIVLDACRKDHLSCYGYDRPTSPAMDALAANGALFESHFTQGIWTKISVPSYMTGKYYPVSCLDFGGALNCPREVPEGEMLLPEILRENGYYTILVSAQGYISPRSALYKAFDESHVLLPERGTAAYVDFEALNEIILPIIQEPKHRPFFLYIHAMDTHFPHVLEPPFDQWMPPKYESESIQNGQPVQKTGLTFSQQDKELLQGMYDGSILQADTAIHEILKQVDSNGLLGETLFLIGSDHGEALGEDGVSWGHEFTFDEVMRVPLIMSGPGIPSGQRIAALTENVDLVPTLLELLDLDAAARPDGQSLLPLIHGTKESLREHVFSRWYTQGYDKPNGFIIRNHSFKYEYDPMRNHEELYIVPDTGLARKSVKGDRPDLVDAFRALRQNSYEPLWNAYDALPRLYHDLFFTPEFVREFLTPQTSIVFIEGQRPESADDFAGVWALVNAMLWSPSWLKSPPPLTITCQVPPGRYMVSMLILQVADFMGHPVSTVDIKLPGNSEFRKVEAVIFGDHAEELWLQEIEMIDLPSGLFEASLAAPKSESWSVVGGFRLTAAETYETHLTPEKQEQMLEHLRALGYL